MDVAEFFNVLIDVFALVYMFLWVVYLIGFTLACVGMVLHEKSKKKK